MLKIKVEGVCRLLMCARFLNTLSGVVVSQRQCFTTSSEEKDLPSYIEMMCGWRREDMISISLRICTMSCSSLIFSFRMDLIAT